MLKTEMRNEKSTHIDQMNTADMVKLIAEENENAVRAVRDATPEIAQVIDAVSERMSRGGRIFYVGAGTSGRLGVLDASECPPTFGVSPDRVVGIIAGGYKCLVRAAEAEEDNYEMGQKDLNAYQPTEADSVIAISASGGAQYCVGALAKGNECGCLTVSISSNRDTPMEKTAKLSVVTDTGAEVITGSTRMKAGTAQKLVLNMISTCVMVREGMVYENMMVNLRPTNDKLKKRVVRITAEILHCDENRATALLDENEWSIRRAVESAKHN